MSAPGFADWWAITGLIGRYARLADERRSADMAELFAPDGRMLMFRPRAVQPAEAHQGREQLSAAFEALLQFAATSHVLAPSEIVVDGDAARASTACMAHHIRDEEGERTRFTIADRYEDSLVRLDGRWLFLERRKYTSWTESAVLGRRGGPASA